jgi:NitT/TauT family transport system permease protein
VIASPWTLRAASFALVAAAWELTARRVDGLLFPTFSATLLALPGVLLSGELWRAAWVSHQALVLGFMAAIVVGVAAGIVMGRAPWADAFLDPPLTLLLAMPIAALIPVVIMAFGLDLFARSLVVYLFAVALIAVNTRAGLRALDPSWLDMARSFGASERRMWTAIVLPGALPGLVTGLRLGVERAFTGMVSVELLLVAVGLGRLILEFQGAIRGDVVYALVLILVAEAVLLMRALTWVERRFAAWAHEAAAR